jgi:hypothetical protein
MHWLTQRTTLLEEGEAHLVDPQEAEMAVVDGNPPAGVPMAQAPVHADSNKFVGNPPAVRRSREGRRIPHAMEPI